MIKEITPNRIGYWKKKKICKDCGLPDCGLPIGKYYKHLSCITLAKFSKETQLDTNKIKIKR